MPVARAGDKNTGLRKWVNTLFFPPTKRDWAVRYGFAAIASLITFAVRAALTPALLDHAPLLLFTVPVAASAMAAGSGPAALAAVLSAILGVRFFTPESLFAVYPGQIRLHLVQITIFLVTSAMIAKLGGAFRVRRWEAETTAEQLRQTLAERDAALEKVSVLTGLLPVCAACKSIQDEAGNWRSMETYLSEHSQAKFTHGMCPSCMENWYGKELSRENQSHHDTNAV